MVSLEHNCGNISPTICTNMLIFGTDTFLDFLKLLYDFKKSHKFTKFKFCDVTPYLSVQLSSDLSLDLRRSVQRVIGSNPVGFKK